MKLFVLEVTIMMSLRTYSQMNCRYSSDDAFEINFEKTFIYKFSVRLFSLAAACSRNL